MDCGVVKLYLFSLSFTTGLANSIQALLVVQTLWNVFFVTTIPEIIAEFIIHLSIQTNLCGTEFYETHALMEYQCQIIGICKT